ncbi:hypothetical protein K488DRAFT_81692 [Vararia minispora EC-137]|uniref:Uncharacterized protein n=1 Tax=Vararia minispora EC-137 TaxID=1314806 RepID=A0ACB8R006_9AGAM|nr:hypothetical protein K488DRAFT_81692 [Vararia minispora EC-137]
MATATGIPFMSDVWADLPIELVRAIFEFAAASDRQSALTLSLVCVAARSWTAPALYRTVRLDTARALKAFTIVPPAFTVHVQHLGIFAPGPLSAICTVLAACTDTRSLACGVPLAPLQSTVPASTAAEQHLLAGAITRCRDDEAQWDDWAPGGKATRLRVQLPGGAGWDVLAPERLRHWPALTHLAVVFTPCADAADAREAFDAAMRAVDELGLALVLLQVAGGAARRRATMEELSKMTDERKGCRIVVGAAPLSPSRQWELATRDGTSIWSAAEKIVATRRAAPATVTS